MTEQLNSIQQLLVELKRAIQQPQPPPWAIYQHCSEQRQLLIRTKEVLALLAEQSAAQQSIVPPSEGLIPQSALAEISQDLNQLRGALLLPLQQEVQQLLQTRSSLQSEIAGLEAQLAQTQSQHTQINPAIDSALDLQQVHDRATALMSQLDSTIQLTFSSLDQDVETYRIALTRQLAQLYDLGQRSEGVVAMLLRQVIDEAQQAGLAYAKTSQLQSQQNQSLPQLDSQLQSSSQIANPITQPARSAAPELLSSTDSIQGQSRQAENTILSLAELLDRLGLTASSANAQPSATPVLASQPVTPLSAPTFQANSTLDDSNIDFVLTGFNDLFDNN